MESVLIITSVEKLQDTLIKEVKSGKETCIYLSLNKTRKNISSIFQKNNIDLTNLYFIDGVSETGGDEDIDIPPNRLDLMNAALKSFVKGLDGRKRIIIDSLGTLLIYNDENKVAKFVKKLAALSSQNDVSIIAFSPKTKGEELLNKIFNFFDRVEKR